MMKEYKGLPVLVAGFSVRSGVGAARMLYKSGAKVGVWDDRAPQALAPVLKSLGSVPVRKHFKSKDPGSILKNYRAVVLSPGVPRTHDLVKAARVRKIPVISEVELAWHFRPQGWLAITGTDGKSTTTALTGEIFRQAGRKVLVAGNIGISLCSGLLGMPKPDHVIAELSSFQLESVKDLRPDASVIMNITPDHLDRYKSFMHYAVAKTAVYQNQGPEQALFVRSGDRMISSVLKKNPPGCPVYRFSSFREPARGLFVHRKNVFWKPEKGRKAKPLFPVEGFAAKGLHNLENVLAAAGLALFSGIRPSVIRKTVRSFAGLEHRMEDCGRYKGRNFVNDSKATTLNAVAMALKGRTEPVILMLGGKSKGDDFSALTPLVKKNVRQLILFGESASLIRRQIKIRNAEQAYSLKDAFKKAWDISQSGETVLLSPGCASFDEFSNFEERGRVFKSLVRKLKRTL